MLEHTQPPLRAPHRTILLVVEEPTIRELLVASFRHAGFFPVAAASALEGRRLSSEVRPDVVLVDLDAPATADRDLLATPTGHPGTVPSLSVVLTSRPDLPSTAANSAGGGLCVVGKPFSPRELVSRVMRELAARSAREQPRTVRKLRVGSLEFDPTQHCMNLHREGTSTELALAPTELKLLRCLMEHPGQLLSREQLISQVWGDGGEVDPRTVDQNIRRLRRCLEAAGSGALIKTVRGLGYRLDIAAAPLRLGKAPARQAGS